MPLMPTSFVVNAAVSDAWTTVVKTVDESVDTNTTPQNDDELFFQTEAGVVYNLEGGIIYASPAGGGTPDLKTIWGEDATIRGFLAIMGVSNTDANFTGYAQTNQTATLILGTLAADRHARMSGLHVGNGGVFRLQWAQNASSGNATIVRAGSFLRYLAVT